ncbi:MAG: M28 family metallopeptidase [Thermoproteota archaeon]|jgi:Iap family predicted aminopeptidase
MEKIDENLLGEEAYRFLFQLNYERFTGSEGEKKAREFIARTMKEAGYEVRFEEFKVNVYKIIRSELFIVEPWTEKIECEGLGFSGSTSEEGVTAPINYVETGDRHLLLKAKGSIFLLSESPPSFNSLLELKNYDPKGIVVSEGSPGRKPSHVARLYEVSEKFKVPTVFVKFEDAVSLVKKEARKAKLVLMQEEHEASASNIIFEKEGNTYPDEVIVVGAHYDSVYNALGIIDNAGGVALLMEIAKVVSKLSTKRTIRFILFSGEELGLRGSMNYCKAHKEELEKIKLMINLDVNGGAIGGCNAIVTGNQELKTYAETISKELGINLRVNQDVMSSDSNSFSYYGVPSVSFFRRSGAGFFNHTSDDDLRFVAPIGFRNVELVTLNFLLRVANAEVLPFSREIPEDIKKKVQDYFKERGYEVNSF